MAAAILTTKLYFPPAPLRVVRRAHLVERLSEGMDRKLTLISAPAGSGKTTLVSEWGADCGRPVAWVSLDEGDGEPARFLAYLIAALQTILPGIGIGELDALHSPQPPSIESILTALLNQIAAIPSDFSLVLDDYHLAESPPVNRAVGFLLDHLPPQMHVVIATREDPALPLPRYRVRGQLTELRAADLRLSFAEAAGFFNQLMGLNLATEEIAILETRTEGWIAGLQLAALSLQGHQDVTGFIKSFAGSHSLVLDYLVEEVLQQQTDDVQTFLLVTSIVDRMCGPLCEAILSAPTCFAQGDLEALERANLFLVPLDNERFWYRYHHLFGELLRKRLGQKLTAEEIAELHVRASDWFESNSMAFEAFRHAAAAHDIGRAERLIENRAIGLHLRSVALPVLDWLASLPNHVLDARPQLWVRSATLALMAGQTTGVETKLQAAEAALVARASPDGTQTGEQSDDLIGQIACARATLALTRYDPPAMAVQARRALEYLHPENLVYRFAANWALAAALKLQGDRAGAAAACQLAIAISERSGHVFSRILATHELAHLQEMSSQLYRADETYLEVVRLSGDHPQPNASGTFLGLARIHYEWNDLTAAERYGQESLRLARQFDPDIDRYIVSEVFLARLKLACGDADGAAALLAQTDASARRRHFLLRLPEIAAAQVAVLLRQGYVTAAAQLVEQHELPLCRARVALAQGDASAALTILEPLCHKMKDRGWADDLLKTMSLQAVALHAHGEGDKAMQQLSEVLALAEPGGFIRLFVDEGDAMAQLLSRAVARGIRQDYAARILAASRTVPSGAPPGNRLDTAVAPLSQRELEVLRLIAQGLSNQEIGKRLFLALDTVKGHNRRIFDKLQVHRRTEAIAQARKLGLV